MIEGQGISFENMINWSPRGKSGPGLVPVHGNPLKPDQVTGYVERKVVVAVHDDMPDELPDGTKLLTKGEKIKQDFEKAGEPNKGAVDD